MWNSDLVQFDLSANAVVARGKALTDKKKTEAKKPKLGELGATGGGNAAGNNAPVMGGGNSTGANYYVNIEPNTAIPPMRNTINTNTNRVRHVAAVGLLLGLPCTLP